MRITVLLISLVLPGCGQNIKMPPTQLDIMLDAPVDSVVGHKWPQWDNGYADVTAVEQPRIVTIFLRNRVLLKSTSKVTFLKQKENRVCSVVIAPLLDEVAFERAIKTLKEMNKQLQIQNAESVEATVNQWKAGEIKKGNSFTRSFSSDLGDDISVFVELKPVNSQSRYFISYEFIVNRFYDVPEELKSF